jgi:hypothetical protein
MTKIWVLAEYEFGGNMKVDSAHSTLRGARYRQRDSRSFSRSYIFEYDLVD